jgi:electron transfer flavoprotein beta subunit
MSAEGGIKDQPGGEFVKIFVCIKQVPDTESKIQLRADRNSIEETGLKWVMNPYDEFAVEEALKVKEANAGATVTVLSLGPKGRIVDALRTALAMGADDAVAIDAPEGLDTFTTAQALSRAIKKEGDGKYIFTGKLAIDDNSAAVGQMIAEQMSIPHVTVVSKIAYEGDKVTVEREVEGGAREIFQVTTPCVLAANKGLNTPRYASLPGIMKAKKKPVKELTLADLDLAVGAAKIRFKNFELPKDKPPVKMIAGDAGAQAKELVNLLMHEAKVL